MWLAYSSKGTVHYQGAWWHSDRYCSGEVLNISTSGSATSRKTENLDLAKSFENSKPTPSDTHSPERPHLLVLLILLKSSTLWWLRIQLSEPIGPFLFKKNHIFFLWKFKITNINKHLQNKSYSLCKKVEDTYLDIFFILGYIWLRIYEHWPFKVKQVNENNLILNEELGTV